MEMEDYTEEQYDAWFASETLNDLVIGFNQLAQQVRRNAAPGKYAHSRKWIQLTKEIGVRIHNDRLEHVTMIIIEEFLESLSLLSHYEIFAASSLFELLRIGWPIDFILESVLLHLTPQFQAINRLKFDQCDRLLCNYLNYIANAQQDYINTLVHAAPWRTTVPGFINAFSKAIQIALHCLGLPRNTILSMPNTCMVIPYSLTKYSVTHKQVTRRCIKMYIPLLTSMLRDNDTIQVAHQKLITAFHLIFDRLGNHLVAETIMHQVAVDIGHVIRNIHDVATSEDGDLIEFLLIWNIAPTDPATRLEMLETLFIFVGRNYNRVPIRRRQDAVALMHEFLNLSPPISETLRVKATRWLHSTTT